MEKEIDLDIKLLYTLINDNKLDEASKLENHINEQYSSNEKEANKEIFLLLKYKRDKQSILNTVDKIIELLIPNNC